jgi:hypothetical protein
VCSDLPTRIKDEILSSNRLEATISRVIFFWECGEKTHLQKIVPSILNLLRALWQRGLIYL